MTTIPPTKPRHVHLHNYFRLEIPYEFQEMEEYVRIEINEDGDIEETIGLKINELEFEEVVGLDLLLVEESDFAKTTGFECPLDMEEYDSLEEFRDLESNVYVDLV